MAKLDTDSSNWFEVSDITGNMVLGTVTSPDDGVSFIQHLKTTYRRALKLTEFLVLFHTRCAYRTSRSGQLVKFIEKIEPVRKIYILPDGSIEAKDI